MKPNRNITDVLFEKGDLSQMDRMGIYRWDIVMVHDCNLRCAYCATAHGNFGQAEKVMSLETAKALAERIVQYADSTRMTVSLGFGGGESFLHFDHFITIYDLIANACHAKGIRVQTLVATNGTLLDEARFQKLITRRINLGFSIDGPEDVHDANRRTAGGQGTFQTAFANWQRYRVLMQEEGSSPEGFIHSMFSLKSGALKDICAFWLQQGIPLNDVVPVNPSRFSDAADRRNVKHIQDAYLKGLREWALEQAGTCTAMTFLRDYRGPKGIFEGWRRLLLGEENTFCTPARGVLGVGCDGDLYPCEPYIGISQWKLGDLFNGIDAEKVSAFVKCCEDAQAHCEGCRHRKVCGKACFGIVATDTPSQNVKRGCRTVAKRDARIMEESFRKLMRNKNRGDCV